MSRHLKFFALSMLASTVTVAACSSANSSKLPVYVDFPATNSCAVGRTMCGAGCADTFSHPQNCGVCSNACPDNQACVGGHCTATCSKDLTLCGDLCVNLMTTAKHCGACGTSCPSGQACSNGACTTTACPGSTVAAPVFTNEGPSTACVNVVTDSNNCGEVGAVWPMARPALTDNAPTPA